MSVLEASSLCCEKCSLDGGSDCGKQSQHQEFAHVVALSEERESPLEAKKHPHFLLGEFDPIDFSIRYYGIPYNLSTKSQQIRTQKRFSDQEDHGNGWRDSPMMNRKIE